MIERSSGRDFFVPKSLESGGTRVCVREERESVRNIKRARERERKKEKEKEGERERARPLGVAREPAVDREVGKGWYGAESVVEADGPHPPLH